MNECLGLQLKCVEEIQEKQGKIKCVFKLWDIFLHQQTLGNGYVTLCDITEAMVLCAKGPLLQVTMDKFKYMVK